MKPPKMTPGPWKQAGAFIIRDEPQVETTRGTVVSSIARIQGELVQGTHKANARAIAALPECLNQLSRSQDALRAAEAFMASRGVELKEVTRQLARNRAALLAAGFTD